MNQHMIQAQVMINIFVYITILMKLENDSVNTVKKQIILNSDPY